jgi:hypothetical protein
MSIVHNLRNAFDLAEFVRCKESARINYGYHVIVEIGEAAIPTPLVSTERQRQLINAVQLRHAIDAIDQDSDSELPKNQHEGRP